MLQRYFRHCGIRDNHGADLSLWADWVRHGTETIIVARRWEKTRTVVVSDTVAPTKTSSKVKMVLARNAPCRFRLAALCPITAGGISNNPATGRLTILDCPRAILAMLLNRSFLLSNRSTSLPKRIFRITLRMFFVKYPIPAIKAITKIILGMYCIVYLVSCFRRFLVFYTFLAEYRNMYISLRV